MLLSIALCVGMVAVLAGLRIGVLAGARNNDDSMSDGDVFRYVDLQRYASCGTV